MVYNRFMRWDGELGAAMLSLICFFLFGYSFLFLRNFCEGCYTFTLFI